MSISFKKKVSATVPTTNVNINRFPSGTRLNSNGTILLTSTGILSLDTFIGGGLPIGSLLLIYEDPTAMISDSILRCYLSEGIYNQQDLCFISSRNDLTETLPVKDESMPRENSSESVEQEKMKIAWRYENLSTLDSSHQIHYDLQTTKSFPSELFDQINIHKFNWKTFSDSQSTDSFRSYLLKQIEQLIRQRYSSQQTEKRIVRLAIPSLSSSLFETDNEKHFDELVSFLYYLRTILRTSLATCIITFNEKSKIFETIADMVINLKLSNFNSTDYVGFCQLIKLPRLNTIQPLIPETWDIGIKLMKHRRNLLFEKYSIPPDLSDEASREEKSKTFSYFLIERRMDDEEEETSSFRSHLFDMSMKRSNSSPALPLFVNATDHDMQFDDIDFCESKLRRYSSSFSSQSRNIRFAHIMRNEMTNPIADEVSQERDLHDNLKMTISFTDLAVGDEQNLQQNAHTIDSRRSSVNSSDSSNLCYSSSPSPSTPARTCTVVSNQRQCYSPALQQQVAPFQCYLASPPSRSQSPIGMVTVISNITTNPSTTKITSFPPNLKRKNIDDINVGCTGKKSRIASDNESLFGPTNSPESPSSGAMESNGNLLTTQQSLNILSSMTSSSSSCNNNANDDTHFKPIQHPDNDLFPPPNSPSICPSPTNSTSSVSSLTFTPISPASTTSSSSNSFLLLPTNFNRSTVIPLSSIVPPAMKHSNVSKKKYSRRHQLQRDRSLDESSSLQALSVLLPSTSNNGTASIIPEEKSMDSNSEGSFFFSSTDNNSTSTQ